MVIICTSSVLATPPLFRVPDRSNQTALEMTGANFENILSCDGYAGYDILQTARCNPHLLRRVRDLMEAIPKRYADLQAICELLRASMHLGKTRSDSCRRQDAGLYPSI